MGPEIFAIIFVVCIYLGWKGAAYIDYKRGIGAPMQPKEVEAPLACEALVTRVFEQRLVEADIMTVEEMTTCDSLACKDCLPTHQEKNAVTNKRLLKSLNSRKPKKIEMPNGYEANWPDAVPEHAHYVVEEIRNGRGAYGGWEVMFSWVDTSTGQTMGRRMMVPDFTRTSDDFVIYSDQQIEPVRRPMAGKSRADAIAELRRNPPRPPKGSGGGSPKAR